jgi:hypothetical protein
MTDLEIIALLFATLFGSIAASVLGWLDSNTPFNARKFYPSLIRGAIAAAITFTASYVGFVGPINLFTYLAAFFAGGGFDALGNHVSGLVQALPAASNPTASLGPTTSIPPPPSTAAKIKHYFYIILPYIT